jgi:STELLO glycosyltransferases
MIVANVDEPLCEQHMDHPQWSNLCLVIPGRVSDIWRSFVAQALFKTLGLAVGFLPRPLVVQQRNPHSYEADFTAELPLYLQGSVLVPIL